MAPRDSPVGPRDSPAGAAAIAVAALLLLLLGTSGRAAPCLRPRSITPEAHGAERMVPQSGPAPKPGRAPPLSSKSLRGGVTLRGHEWMGGATGRAERPGVAERWGGSQHQPANATLLLLGVVSGSKNFDNRNWVRRAFWSQRPWRFGVNFRFVVGGVLPRGDNDRLSLDYERARWADLDIVARGSELPPRQARTPLRWWIYAASLAALPEAPCFFGLTYDAVLVSLPRLALRLRSLGATRHQRGVADAKRFVYGGDLRWAAWADGDGRPAAKGAAWRCVEKTAGAERLAGRLAGDGAPIAADGLSRAARMAAADPESGGPLGLGRGACKGSPAGGFLAAGPELQLLSSALLLRVRPSLGHRLASHRLEVTPPHELWDRSLVHHQGAEGRSPSGPALLAATAIGRAVHNASRTRSVTYARLRTSRGAPPFTWDEGRSAVPGPQSLLARGIDNGIAAEAVAERFERMRTQGTPQPRVRCARARCVPWGVPPERDAVCCEEQDEGSSP